MYYDIVESGKRIKEMRKKAGMTQAELAELTVKRLLSIIATDKDILMVKRVVGMRVRKR